MAIHSFRFLQLKIRQALPAQLMHMMVTGYDGVW